MGNNSTRALALAAAAATLAVGFAPAMAMADTVTAEDRTVVMAASRYSIDDLKNIVPFYEYYSGPNMDKIYHFDGFDYRNPGPWYMPDGDTHAGIQSGIPAGWSQKLYSDGDVHVDIIAPDGTKIITYTFKVKEEHVDQNGIQASLNGVPWSGWSESTTSYDLRAQYPNGAKLSFTNLPAGVTVQAFNSTYNGAPTTLVRFVQNGVVSKDYNFLGATYDPNGGTTGQPSTPSNPNGTGKPSQPSTPSEPQPEEGMQHVYRLYDGRSGRHFWTASVNERDALVRGGWRYEGVGFDMPTSGNPVYRAYNPRSGDHLWTLSAREYQVVTSNGWRAEGIGFYANDGANPVYRLYNGRSGDHMWTKSANERDALVRGGWRYEGIAWTTKG